MCFIGTQSKANGAAVPPFFRNVGVGEAKKQSGHRSRMAGGILVMASLVCADGGLNLRLINIKVGVHVLHVIVLFEGLDQTHHLRGLRTG